jgi:hypothetical protein
VHREFERVNASRHSVALDNCSFDHCAIFVLTFSFVFTLCFVLVTLTFLASSFLSINSHSVNPVTRSAFTPGLFAPGVLTLGLFASIIVSHPVPVS